MLIIEASRDALPALFNATIIILFGFLSLINSMTQLPEHRLRQSECQTALPLMAGLPAQNRQAIALAWTNVLVSNGMKAKEIVHLY